MRELRDKTVALALVRGIEGKIRQLGRPVRLMEVCGTHTMAIHRFGLKPLLDAAGVEMVSGPGCPVCITPNEIHEACLGLLTERENLILASFGDMTRVPTRRGSLQTSVPAASSRLQLVYSPAESVELARANPTKAGRLLRRRVRDDHAGDRPDGGAGADPRPRELLRHERPLADPSGPALDPRRRRDNGQRLSLSGPRQRHHRHPPLQVHRRRVRHTRLCRRLRAERYPAQHLGRPRPAAGGQAARRTSSTAGPSARTAMLVRSRPWTGSSQPADACWRGLGRISRSSLTLRAAYRDFDAAVRFGLRLEPGSADLPGCRCGEVLRGLISPPECGLFGKKCRPDSPFGPCMVSLEGACSSISYQKYGR